MVSKTINVGSNPTPGAMKYIILLGMIFCHIIEDYGMQGILASMKQKKWWEENTSNPLYKYDYIPALIEHAFEWSCMMLIPVLIWCLFMNIDWYITIVIMVLINTIIHAFIDDLKANKFKINLWQDQLFHLIQIIITWKIMFH